MTSKKSKHASQHRRDAARQMRDVDREAGMAVEDAGIYHPERRHDQRKFAPDRARGVVAVELLREIELQRRMHEHEHAEPFRFAPERLVFGRIEKTPPALRT